MSGVDVSTLQVKVVSDGIKEASSALGGLSTSANNAEKRVNKLTDTISKLVGAQGTATAAATGLNAALGASSTATAKQSNASDQLVIIMQKMLSLTNTMQYDLTKISTAMSQVAANTAQTTNAVLGLSTAMSMAKPKVDENTQSIKRNTLAMEDAHAMARGLTGSLGALWLTYGNMIPMAAGAAMGLAFKQIVSVGSDVEHTLEGIRVRGTETVESVNKIREAVETLGQGVYGPREVAKGFDVLIMAGLNAEQALHGIRDALNLATVGGTTIEKSAEVLVQVGTALNMDANAYGRIGDVIAMTAATSMSSVESVSESFKAGSVVGKMYGASLEDIGTAFAMLSNLGIKGSAAGTSLKNFYSVLQAGSKKTTEALSALGLSLGDLRDKTTGDFLPLVDMFKTLSTHMDKTSEANQKLAMSLLSNERGAKVMVEALSQIRKEGKDTATAMEDLRKKIDESYGFTAVGAAAMAMTVESQFKSVKNTLEVQFLKAFQDIQPQLSMVATQLKAAFNSPEFARGIQSIALGLADMAQWLAKNIELITNIIELFVGWKLASMGMSVVLPILTAFSGGLEGVATALASARVAALSFQASLGILGLALAAATAAIMWYNSKKSESSDATKTAMNYMDDFNGKLNDEATRLETQARLMKEGKTATEAQTQALRDQQLALVALQGQKAIDAAGQKRDSVVAGLNSKQQRLYETAMTNGQESVQGGLSVNAVNEALKAQRDYTAAVDQTKQKWEEVVKNQERVATASKVIREQQDKQNADNRKAGGDAPFNPKGPDKAAIAAANAELDKFNKKIEDINAAIKNQIDLQNSIRLFGADYEKIGEGARKYALVTEQIVTVQQRMADGQAKATDAALLGHLKIEQAAALRLKTEEAETQRLKDQMNLQKSEEAKMDTRIAKVKEEADAWERKASAYKQGKGAAEELHVEQLKLQADGIQDTITMEGGNAALQKQLEQIQKLIPEVERLSAAKQAYQVEQNTDASNKSMEKLLDPSRANRFGQEFAKAFGAIGKSIDEAGKSLNKFDEQQKLVAKAREDLNKKTNLSSDERAKREDTIRKYALKSDIEMYASMAGAAKSFFGEKTVAYKAFDALEKGMRAAQLAMTIEEFAVKNGLIEANLLQRIGAAVAGMFADDADTTNSVANSGVKAAASTTAGVAKAFEQLGVWGFVGAAAIIAFMASMGVSGGGGGASVDPAKLAQASQGTGTVLGDPTAKSDSLAKSLNDLNNTSTIGLEYSSKMVGFLRSINDGISGMAALVAQSQGLTGNAADQNAVGVGSSKSFAGFSSSSTSLTDSGLLFAPGQTVGSVRGGGIGVNGYMDVHKESSSFWGLSHSSSNERILSDVGESLKRQISLTITNIADGAFTAAQALGVGSQALKDQLERFTVDIGQISLKGLSGADVEKALQGVFSKWGDEIASTVLPGFTQFQKVGEGGFQTLVRLATGVETAKVQLDNLGVSMIAYTDITNKQGDIETELIRQSIAMKEAGSNVADIISNMNGAAQDLVDTYKKLIDARQSLRALNLSQDISDAMIRGAGGLDTLQSSLGNLLKGFYTSAEQQAVAVSKLKSQFDAIGVVMPQTKDDFKNLVNILLHTGDAASQELGARVLALAGDFDTAATAVQDAHKTLVSDATTALTDAYNAQTTALTNLQTQMDGYVKSLTTYQNTLIQGSLSPLSAYEKYANAMQAYQDNLTKAKAGDATAIGNFQSLADTMLNASRTVNASGAQYTQDFQQVQAATNAIIGTAQNQANTATQQLEQLKASVEGLITVNNSVLTVAQAIANLQAALTGSQAITVPINGSHATGLANVPFDGYIAELHKGERVLTASENSNYKVDYSKYGANSGNDALVLEIQSLRQELTALRQDQAAQTGQLIAANYDANERSAEQVVDGMKSAAADTAYAPKLHPTFN